MGGHRESGPPGERCRSFGSAIQDSLVCLACMQLRFPGMEGGKYGRGDMEAWNGVAERERERERIACLSLGHSRKRRGVCR